MTSRHLARLPRIRLDDGHVLITAATPLARLVGLSGTTALPPEHGLLLPGCRSVHTVGMRFGLDLVWLDARGRPLHVDDHVVPRRVRSCLRARSVVEVAAGGGPVWWAVLAQAAGGFEPEG